jgi:response regulator of citrate/malate metabolism
MGDVSLKQAMDFTFNEKNKDLLAGERVLLLKILYLLGGNDSGSVSLSASAFGKEIHSSTRTVQRYVKRLKDIGILNIENVKDGTGKILANNYQITAPTYAN